MPNCVFHLSQFGFDVLLLQGRDADVLDVLLVLQQRSLQNVAQAKARTFQVKCEACKNKRIIVLFKYFSL